ncbi:MAG: hypothetical protein JW832_15110 [Deltaproteobacteria bacterium]|nr:hypothetical protein [Deltaproteobacteria bacterium]
MSNDRKQKKNGRRSLDAQLLTYCAVAGGVLAAAQPAGASIVYSGVKNLALADEAKVAVDLDGNGVVDFEFNNLLPFNEVAGTDFAKLKVDFIKPAAGNRVAFYQPYGSFSSYIVNLGAGAAVPGENIWWLQEQEDNQQGLFLDAANIMQDDGKVNILAKGYFANSSGYLGLSFTIDGNPHYGWIKYKGLGSDNNTALNGTIVDWAYEDAVDTPIAAGQKAGAGTGTCFVTMTPGTLSKFKNLFVPVTGIIIRGDADATFTRETKIDWGTDSLKTLAKLRIGSKLIIALVRVKPLYLTGSETFDVSVGDCSGTLKVSPF